MAFTYDAAQLANNPLFQVRSKIRDTRADDQLLQDEEITDCLLEENGKVYLAAAAACERIVLELTREMGVRGDTVYDPEAKAEMYRRMAEKYRKLGARSGMGAASVFAGGISKADVAARKSDGDAVAPSFTATLHTAAPLVDPLTEDS
jgi:hypothetical protein